MASVGTRTVDIRNAIKYVFGAFSNRVNQVCSGTCDGFVLKMHYRVTSLSFFALFLSTWYLWYHREVITCVSQFNAAVNQTRLDYLNICLSYPYVEEGENKRFILYYRWINFVALLLAGVYYIPRKVSKQLDNPKTKSLVETLCQHSPKTGDIEKQVVTTALRYIVGNAKTHNGIYYKYLFVNLVALIIDIVVFFFLDFIFIGRFMWLGIDSFPIKRDPENFSDYISQTFPPFAKCQINMAKMLTSGRIETFGCHLTFMELYEKIFIALWFWLVFLVTATAIYLLFLLTMHFQIVQRYIIRVEKPARGQHRVGDLMPNVFRNFRVGDIYLLYRIKQHVSHDQFYGILTNLSKPDLFTIKAVKPSLQQNDVKDSMFNPKIPHNNNISKTTEKTMLNSSINEKNSHNRHLDFNQRKQVQPEFISEAQSLIAKPPHQAENLANNGIFIDMESGKSVNEVSSQNTQHRYS
ncbi:unnamed protein product [Meganyctiphanes norvegica]|uniref:Innexin n=1 Tax=Meganyctiphanes norvegica TaxID=48144 RepID=A0AAV2R5S6_MEGNR